MPPCATALPLEITDQIMDQLKGDSRSASQCSLVSKTWLCSARPHILSIIVLHEENSDQFCSIIKNPNSTIPTFARCLTLMWHKRNSEWFERLVPFLPTLHSVTTLRLENLPSARVSGIVPSHFALTVTRLELNNISFDYFSQATGIASQFPLLRSLTLNNVVWASISPSPCARQTCLEALSSSHLTELTLANCDIRSIIYWLRHHTPIPVVTTLRLLGVTERDIFEVERYLHLLGPHLLHCTWSINAPLDAQVSDLMRSRDATKYRPRNVQSFNHPSPIPLSQAQIPYPIPVLNDAHRADLEETLVRYGAIDDELLLLEGGPRCEKMEVCTSLRSFSLPSFIHHTDSRVSDAVRAPKILLSLRSPYLEYLSFGVELSRAGEVDVHTIKWAFLDRVLTEGRNERLKTVEIVYGGGIKHDVVKELFCRRWPVCAAQGKLLFTPRQHQHRR